VSQTDRLIASFEKALAELGAHLEAEYPGSSIVGFQVDVATRVPAGLRAAIAREQARQQRIADNAADRARRMAPKAKWEPYEIEAAAKMGFTDPADWRAYMTDKQATFNAGKPIPTPEEWRAGRG
jgi:hypothetical protein